MTNIAAIPCVGFPGDSGGKESAYNVEDLGLTPVSGRSPERPTPVLLSREFHGWRSLEGYRSRGC